ncbi:MAG: hypothetical protein WKG32_19650, partial [Gemmatimonadaceae bacterium]
MTPVGRQAARRNGRAGQRGSPRWLRTVIGLAIVGRSASAQVARTAPARLQPELRADAFIARATTLQGGVGAAFVAGRSVRVALLAGGGRAWQGGESGPSARVDVIARLLLDPERRSRWGLYAGAGAG